MDKFPIASLGIWLVLPLFALGPTTNLFFPIRALRRVPSSLPKTVPLTIPLFLRCDDNRCVSMCFTYASTAAGFVDVKLRDGGATISDVSAANNNQGSMVREIPVLKG